MLSARLWGGVLFCHMMGETSVLEKFQVIHLSQSLFTFCSFFQH